MGCEIWLEKKLDNFNLTIYFDVDLISMNSNRAKQLIFNCFYTLTLSKRKKDTLKYT